MTSTLIAIIALACLAVVWLGYAKKAGKPTAKDGDCTQLECSSCVSAGTGCEQERIMKSAVEPIAYYDDEELDTYKGRPSDEYKPEEVEQFAYVLHTMREDEVGGWMRSLARRGVNIPDELKDEVIMMIEDGHP